MQPVGAGRYVNRYLCWPHTLLFGPLPGPNLWRNSMLYSLYREQYDMCPVSWFISKIVNMFLHSCPCSAQIGNKCVFMSWLYYGQNDMCPVSWFIPTIVNMFLHSCQCSAQIGNKCVYMYLLYHGQKDMCPVSWFIPTIVNMFLHSCPRSAKNGN
jgi:hypothetical protein